MNVIISTNKVTMNKPGEPPYRPVLFILVNNNHIINNTIIIRNMFVVGEITFSDQYDILLVGNVKQEVIRWIKTNFIGWLEGYSKSGTNSKQKNANAILDKTILKNIRYSVLK